MLSYHISHGLLKPGPECLCLFLDFPVPTDKISLQQVVCIFAYYTKWIPKFSDKIKPFKSVNKYPFKGSEI